MRSTYRISIFLLILIIISPGRLLGQEIFDRSIVLPDTLCELYAALLMLEQETGYRFSYNSDLIPSHRQCRLTGSAMTIKDILDELIDNPSITYKVKIGRAHV
jgi:hypothetical protein